MKRLGVLPVDDEIMIREGFKRLFDWETHGCEVVGEAADGMEALAKIDALVPDIVIIDINIPIMNGLKVIELARLLTPWCGRLTVHVVPFTEIQDLPA